MNPSTSAIAGSTSASPNRSSRRMPRTFMLPPSGGRLSPPACERAWRERLFVEPTFLSSCAASNYLRLLLPARVEGRLPVELSSQAAAGCLRLLLPARIEASRRPTTPHVTLTTTARSGSGRRPITPIVIPKRHRQVRLRSKAHHSHCHPEAPVNT